MPWGALGRDVRGDEGRERKAERAYTNSALCASSWQGHRRQHQATPLG